MRISPVNSLNWFCCMSKPHLVYRVKCSIGMTELSFMDFPLSFIHTKLTNSHDSVPQTLHSFYYYVDFLFWVNYSFARVFFGCILVLVCNCNFSKITCFSWAKRKKNLNANFNWWRLLFELHKWKEENEKNKHSILNDFFFGILKS